jgi:hypothetical protein
MNGPRADERETLGLPQVTQHVPEHAEKYTRKDGNQLITAHRAHTDWCVNITGNGSQRTTAERPRKVGKRVLMEPQLVG